MSATATLRVGCSVRVINKGSGHFGRTGVVMEIRPAATLPVRVVFSPGDEPIPFFQDELIRVPS